MKTKKQIDRLFTEKFKDFEVSPPASAWVNIKNSLEQQNKKKKVVPLFWYRIAGAAALFVLFFSVSNYFFQNSNNSPITLENKIPSNTTNNSVIESKENSSVEEKLVLEQNTNNSSEETIQNSSTQQNRQQNNLFKRSSEKNDVAEIQPKKKKSDDKHPVFAQNNSGVENQPVETIRENSEYALVEKTHIDTSKDAKNNAVDTDENPFKEPVLEKEISVEENLAVNTEINQENKKSIFDYIEEKDIALAEVKKKSQDNRNRWSVSPNVAPLYYSSLGNGSSIDAQFTNNDKSGDINYGYGVQLSYAITENLSVGTGLNKVDLSYVTNNIQYTVATANSGLKNINHEQTGNYIVTVGNRGNLSPLSGNHPIVTDDGSPIVPRNGLISGEMRQQIDYFEIPLELKYSLINKKFGVNLIGGMSTLLLNNNDISVFSEGFSTVIGEANNLNSLSFSTNVGLGVDYKISKRFILNIEPMFKYQLNPYTDNTSNYKPYYLGVYSGFSYKF